MSQPNAVSEHYTHGDLLQSIRTALTQIDKAPESVAIDDLSPLDEFHIGGRAATTHLLEQLNPSAEAHLIDIGCGLGGPARYVAKSYACQLTGIDLTPEFVETGTVMTEWVGLEAQVKLEHGSALSLPFDDATFDGGYMLHVGMNIEDKATLFGEIFRVLRPGARFGVYDVMRAGEGALTYPFPWAEVADTSFVSTAEAYKAAMQDAGFTMVAETNRSDFAMAGFDAQRSQNQERGGPPPIGLHTIIGKSIGVKIKNLIEGIACGLLAPVELIGRK